MGLNDEHLLRILTPFLFHFIESKLFEIAYKKECFFKRKYGIMKTWIMKNEVVV